MGMVGGGQGAFIGAVHRMAAFLDGNIELVCGAYSASAEKSLASGIALGVDESRCYASYQQMFEQEQLCDANDRMEAVIIVTPNHSPKTLSSIQMEDRAFMADIKVGWNTLVGLVDIMQEFGGTKWGVIEQEEYPTDVNSVETIRLSKAGFDNIVKNAESE